MYLAGSLPSAFFFGLMMRPEKPTRFPVRFRIGNIRRPMKAS